MNEKDLNDYYQQWIMEAKADEIHTKDQLIEALEDCRYEDEFIQHLRVMLL